MSNNYHCALSVKCLDDRALRWRLKTTQLRGPPRTSFIYGVSHDLASSHDSSEMYERWATEYGVAYMIPSILGQTTIVLCDPRAIAHLYARDTWSYVRTPPEVVLLDTSGYYGLRVKPTGGAVQLLPLRKQLVDYLWIRQRKALTPAFTYKVKGAWDTVIESSKDGDAVIEVQNCMNHISLDTIGIAGFSHDFGSLDGKRASVTDVFDTFAFPIIMKMPTKRTNLLKKLGVTMGKISDELLIRSCREKDVSMSGKDEEKSIIGLLSQDAELHMSKEEVVAQMKVLLLAGYETTSISLTWVLIELSRHSDVQTRLREELLAFGTDPTYDQLKANLPYLDAVVHEILRLHPPLGELTRVVAADDIIPLSEPVCTESGKITDSISIAKGSLMVISIRAINRSLVIWGSDAKEFKPDRWLAGDGISEKAKEVQGYGHLLTFADGPRACLGKDFAIVEFKTVLSLLVKNFVFEMRDGPATAFEFASGILPRPRVVGEGGIGVPLRVCWYE
ncbi:cytochrome P450 [Suillus americanus]|nr:cytochrome P450 [Suillus americanus]